jgi:hypothetical protein
MAKFHLAWEAPEFEYRPKEVSWYWLSIIIAAAMVAFAVWEKNFLFGFFIVVAEMLFIVWGNRVPKMINFTLTDTEIDLQGYRSHLIKEFESWSFDSNAGEWADIVFYFRSRMRPPLIILVPEEDAEEIRANLKTALKEIDHEPTLIDSIEKFLRF